MDDLYWTLARREIQLKIQLKLGEMNALVLANHAAIMLVVAGVTGNDVTESGPPSKEGVTDLAAGHNSVEDAVAAINRGLRFAG